MADVESSLDGWVGIPWTLLAFVRLQWFGVKAHSPSVVVLLNGSSNYSCMSIALCVWRRYGIAGRQVGGFKR